MGIISYLKYATLQSRVDRLLPRCGARAREITWYGRRIRPTKDAILCSRDRPANAIDFRCRRIAARKAIGHSRSSPTKAASRATHSSRLFDATGERAYLDQALAERAVLKANQVEGDAEHSPWPFRADWRTGEGRGPVSGNMTYILRLYDAMLEKGHDEFAAARASLWDWITRYQIPSADVDGALFAQFFEDHETPTNRTAWAPLNLARYLLERTRAARPGMARSLRRARRFRAPNLHAPRIRHRRLPRAGRGQASLGRSRLDLRRGARVVREGRRVRRSSRARRGKRSTLRFIASMTKAGRAICS